MYLASAFDKKISLCVNYPKGLGEVFCQWMMDNHSGELLLHVEREAYGGRQDVAYMAAMAIFCNINYCVDFLDYMISYYGKSENILARNIIIFLSFVEIIAVYRLWFILHIAIVVSMRWLEAYTNRIKYYVWWYISMGKVLDNLKDNLNMIVDQSELIHDELFMILMMDPRAE